MTTGTDFANVARSYIGTPWKHMGRFPGTETGCGVDCLGVPICVARQLQLVAPNFDVEPYGKIPSAGRIKTGLTDMCETIWLPEMGGSPLEKAEEGLIVMMAYRTEPMHVAVMARTADGRWSIIHAGLDFGFVRENGIDKVTEARIKGLFRAPGIDHG